MIKVNYWYIIQIVQNINNIYLILIIYKHY